MDLYWNNSLTGIGFLWIVVHLLGLLTAWMVRMHTGRRFEAMLQGGFFTCLIVVSLTTVVGHFYCLQMWPLSALTLALMIVLAIVDLGVQRPSAIRLER